MEKKFFITTAIDYSSGDPHIGHVYEKIGADILARWNRIRGRETFFLVGTDEHGKKISDCARENNLSPQDFVDEKSKKFMNLVDFFNISSDYFIRTTSKEHKDFVSEIWLKLKENGDIYLGRYEGFYCVGCEKYFSEDELDDNGCCPIHKKKVNLVSEENYFFRLSKYQDRILDLLESDGFMSPKFRKNEIINRVKEGLEDISVSRPKSSLDWGIEVPFDKNHVTYVWLDALFNYYSGLRDKSFWPADLHVLGKDIQWFHFVYWPAFLMSVGFDLPKKIHSHGMILDSDGHKMSKSLGNVVNPFEMAERYGVDELRYYLFSLGSFSEDLKFSEENFIEKINNDLNNDLGNLVSRVHSMISKYFQGFVPDEFVIGESGEELLSSINIAEDLEDFFLDVEIHKALDLIFSSIRKCNSYINLVEPWKIKDQKELAGVLIVLLRAIKYLGECLFPFMPNKVESLFSQFNLSEDFDFNLNFDFGRGHRISEKKNLFKKVNLEENILKKSEVSKKDMDSNKNKKDLKKKKVLPTDIRLVVGEIIEVNDHPNAEKLYIEKIDVGEDEPRQIISGLKDYFSKEELLGRKVIVVSNLKPAKLRGEISQGMILMAENEKGELGFLFSDSDVGTIIEYEGMEGEISSELIKIDDFFSLDFVSDGKIARLGDFPLKDSKGYVLIEKGIVGRIR